MTQRHKPGRKPRCRQCKNQVLTVSKKRLCAACAGLNQMRNIQAMKNKKGDEFDRWQAGMLKAAGVIDSGDMGENQEDS